MTQFPPSGQQNPQNVSLTLNDIANLIARFTNEHHAKKDLQQFFQFLYQMSIRGMGIGNNGNVDQSGEMVAMAHVRDALVQAYPGKTLNIFDVGSNIGQYIAAALQVFGTQQRRFFCFEPSNAAFKQLQNSVAGRQEVSVFNIGMGDKEETVPLYSNAEGAEIGSLYNRQLDYVGITMRPVENVTIRTIESFAAENNIERIHFLKIDTEGHELKCIEGARKLIDAGRIDFIQFEMGCNLDSRTFFRDFWNALPNYRIARILRDGPFTIERYDGMQEAMGTQNFLATLKK